MLLSLLLTFFYILQSGEVVIPPLRTPCETRVPFYTVYIAREFDPGIIHVSGSARNIYCYCDPDYENWMYCEIFVRPGSHEENIISRRLHIGAFQPSDGSMQLEPFFHLQSADLHNGYRAQLVCYVHPACVPPEIIVTAEIHIRKKIRQPLTRSLSAPKILKRPLKYIPVSLCQGADAVCPIMQTQFEVGDFVYILKKDSPKVEQNEHVVCICHEGMIGLEKQREDHLFVDPLRRLGNTFSTLTLDYDLYRLIESPESCESSNLQEERSPAAIESDDVLRTFVSSKYTANCALCFYKLILCAILSMFCVCNFTHIQSRRTRVDVYIGLEKL